MYFILKQYIFTVYLRSTPDVVYERVKQRARPEEDSLTLKYLQELHDSHERWLMSDDERFNTVPVLVLDADKTIDEVIEQYKKNENKILGNLYLIISLVSLIIIYVIVYEVVLFLQVENLPHDRLGFIYNVVSVMPPRVLLYS